MSALCSLVVSQVTARESNCFASALGVTRSLRMMINTRLASCSGVASKSESEPIFSFVLSLNTNSDAASGFEGSMIA